MVPGVDFQGRPAALPIEHAQKRAEKEWSLRHLVDPCDRALSQAIRAVSDRVLSMLVANGCQFPASLAGACERSESGDLVLTALATVRLKMAVIALAGISALWLLWPAGQTSRGVIEHALRQEAAARSATTGSTVDIVTTLRAIDTSKCPEDFRVAFLRYIHAWESGAVVGQRNAEFHAQASSPIVMAESIVRGYFGDPFGKAMEINAGATSLQQQIAAAHEEIRIAYQKVEEVAVKHGVSGR